MHLKRFIYILWQMILKSIWRLSGGRREKAMGLSLHLHPATVWPGRLGLRMPDDNYRSKIVAFSDLVQAHAVCSAIEGIQNPVIIDIGAHHGAYAILLGGLLKVRGGGVLIAIEPDAANFAILKENVQRNDLQDIVNLVECAVSNFAGEMDFFLTGPRATCCLRIMLQNKLHMKSKSKHSVILSCALVYQKLIFLSWMWSVRNCRLCKAVLGT